MQISPVKKLITGGAIALLAMTAAPTTRSQGLGDILDKAKDTVNKAVNKAKDGADKGADTGSTTENSPAADKPAADAASSGQFLVIERQLATSLRRIAPKGATLLIVSCKPGTDSNKYAYTSACLVKLAGRMQAVSLPAIPASVNAQFAALRAAPPEFHRSQPWEVCKVTVPMVPDTSFGPERVYDYFRYGYKELAGLGRDDNDAAYKMVTPAQLLASYQKTHAKDVADRQGVADESAKEARRVRLAEAAAAKRAGHGPVMWVCTYCHDQYAWPEMPDGFDTGACTKNPNKEDGPHNWVRAR